MEVLIDELNVPEVIGFNYEELKTSIVNATEKYRGLTYTEDQIKPAKEDRAKLNKFKKALSDERIRIKKICLAPYTAFENKINDLVLLIDTPVSEIDAQVKSFEETAKSKKKDELSTFYLANIGDLLLLVPFTKIFDEKWLNASVATKKGCEAMLDLIKRIEADLIVISDLGVNAEFQVKDVYLKNFNLSEALAEKTRLDKVKENLDALAEKKKEETPKVEAPVTQDAPAPKSMPVDTAPKAVKVSFWAEITPDQGTKLKEFFSENSITYGRTS